LAISTVTAIAGAVTTPTIVATAVTARGTVSTWSTIGALWLRLCGVSGGGGLGRPHGQSGLD